MTPEISSVAGLRSGIAAFIWLAVHFPTEGGLGVTAKDGVWARRGLPGEGSGRLGRFRSEGSLCDHRQPRVRGQLEEEHDAGRSVTLVSDPHQ